MAYRLLVLTLLSSLCIACGQAGGLYLPSSSQTQTNSAQPVSS